SNSGCGIIADTGANSVQFLNNSILNSGQCGIGIADGTNQVVTGNKILNTTPVSGGGNTAIYVWKVTSSDPACGPVQISNNIASAIDTSGAANSYWDGGGCGTVTMSNNTFDAAAAQALSPAASKLPPPAIPPLPASCVIASPFSNNTAFPPCGGAVTGSTPPTISISSPVSGASVSGTISVTTSISSNTTSVQFQVDGANSGAAVTSAPFTDSLNTLPLTNGNHVLTAVASNAAGHTATSASVVITVNNPHLTISTTTLTNGLLQTSYSAQLQAAGGTAPYTWSVLSGQLPAGLSLTSTTGAISGTPTIAGSVSFTIQVSDSTGAKTSAVFSINVTTATPPPAASFGNVYLVALENTNYSDVVGTSAMPYLNGLINQYGLAAQYYADTHPSIGNYFMWTTGQILTNNDNELPATFPVTADNAVREVLAAGLTWKEYAESIPSVGYTGGDTVGPDGGTYGTHHDPLVYMSDVLNSPAQLQNIVPFTQFATDLASGKMPNYAFITPNMCNDAHDCSLTVADTWLRTNIDPLIKSAQFQKNGLLIISFDESGSDNTLGGGRVVTVIVSPLAKAGYQSTTTYQEESVLRLMLEGLGIRTLPGASATAPKMWEFFTFTPPT
ncbi:MAG: alkaline phosphatase family protein, partial [Candidatus Acidiferrales bacterium]